MIVDTDKQVLNAASGLGCFAVVLGLILVPPLILPAFILYRLGGLMGVSALHPAFIILFAAISIWGLYRLAGILVRAIPPSVARFAIAFYVGACYTFATFQRELTTARAQLDVTWLAFAMVLFTALGWKAAGLLIAKMHRDQTAREVRG